MADWAGMWLSGRVPEEHAQPWLQCLWLMGHIWPVSVFVWLIIGFTFLKVCIKKKTQEDSRLYMAQNTKIFVIWLLHEKFAISSL